MDRRKHDSYINLWCMVLGIYQLAGGILGLAFGVLLLLQSAQFTVAAFFAVSIILALFAYSTLCGFMLLKQKNLSALRYSQINQYMQLFNFAVGGYLYNYVAGFFLTTGVGLSDSSFHINFNAGLSTCYIYLNTDSTLFLINFNFIALIAIIIIKNIRKSIEDRDSMLQISQLGEQS